MQTALRPWGLLALVMLLAFACAACGGAVATIRPTSPFTAEHAAVFDDGIDYVSRPDALDGDWRDAWDRDMQKRVGFADLISVVTVDTMRTDTNLDRRTTYRLVCSIHRTMLGDAPSDGLTLVVHEGDTGFATVAGNNDQRVLNQSFIAFVKWYQASDTGEVLAHWHLSPASQPIVDTTTSVINRRRASQSGDHSDQPEVIEITN